MTSTHRSTARPRKAFASRSYRSCCFTDQKEDTSTRHSLLERNQPLVELKIGEISSDNAAQVSERPLEIQKLKKSVHLDDGLRAKMKSMNSLTEVRTRVS